jgi:hypothetical protein
MSGWGCIGYGLSSGSRALYLMRCSTGYSASSAHIGAGRWLRCGCRPERGRRGCYGVRCGDVYPGQQLVTVIGKGTRALQQVPASPDAFVWLRLYQSGLDQTVPAGRDDPLWWDLAPPVSAAVWPITRGCTTGD